MSAALNTIFHSPEPEQLAPPPRNVRRKTISSIGIEPQSEAVSNVMMRTNQVLPNLFYVIVLIPVVFGLRFLYSLGEALIEVGQGFENLGD